MLRLAGGQVESLFDGLLPVEVRELPADLAVLDRLLAEPRLLGPIEQAWERAARGHGRPTIPMTARVPDESTVRKLVRRLGPEVVAELTPGGDRHGAAGDPLCRPRRADRLDRGRGRHPLSDRRGTGLAGRAGAGS